MNDYSELKRLAEASTPGRIHDRLDSCGGGLKYTCAGDDGSLVLSVDHKDDTLGFVGPNCEADEAFFLKCTPAVVLALIAEVEQNQRMLLAACVDMGAIRNALKADMNADGDDLLGMVIDLKAQNSRMLGWLKDISKTSGDKGAVMGARQLLKEFGKGDRP